MPYVVVAIVAVIAWWYGAFESFGISPYTYRAEVGYYENGEKTWYVGKDKSRDACTTEAAAMYASLNARNQNRAFSWACRKMQGEEFLDRVR